MRRLRTPLPFLAAVALSALTMALLFLLPATHRAEVGENLRYGLLAGAFAGALLVAAHAAARLLVRRDGHGRRSFFRTLLVSLLLLALMILGLALYMHKPVTGLLLLAAPAVLAPALLLALDAARGAGWAIAAGAAALPAAAVAAVVALGPPGARPDAVVHDAPSAGDLVLLTWNVGSGNPGSRPSRPEHLPHIAGVIRDADADVACLQELGREHLDALLEMLGEPWRGEVSGARDPWATAVLTRRAAELRALGIPELRGGPASGVIEIGGGRVEVLSIHLAPGGASRPRRLAAVALAEHAAAASWPVVIAGDVNADPRSPWDYALPLFTDSAPRDRRTLALLEAIGTDAGRGTAATATLSRRVDRVFVQPELTVVAFRVLHGRRLDRMDHNPVVIRLRGLRQTAVPVRR